MQIAGKEVEHIIVCNENGEVLAVISDTKIINKDGISVTIGDKEVN